MVVELDVELAIFWVLYFAKEPLDKVRLFSKSSS